MIHQAVSIAPKETDNANTLALLIFKINGQLYGLPVTSVVRIIEMATLTHLPGAPEAIQGIINLQGKVVPIMDLRCRLGLPLRPYGLHTPIILADINGKGQILGLVVDAVEDVLDVSPEALELSETIIPAELVEQTAIPMAYLAGVAKVERCIILLLNIQTLLSLNDQTHLFQAITQQETE